MIDQVVTFPSPANGERLDKVVAAGVAGLSRTQAQRLIEEGFVTLNDRVVLRPAWRLEQTGQVTVRIPPPAPASHAAEDIPLDILFEDQQVLVINKSAGLVVHPAAGHPDGTLVNAVLGHDPDLEGVGDEQRPGLVHRLDRDTSGVLVVAKTDAAYQMLQAQFKDRLVEKKYLALVDGHPPTPTGRIETAIGRDPRDRKRMAVVSEAHGRLAITEYYTRESFAAHTLLEVKLLTGRTHQIRVHLAYLKCPVAGDVVYGQHTASVPLERQFLHAAQLTLTLPGSGERRTFSAPLPPDLTRALQTLRAQKIF